MIKAIETEFAGLKFRSRAEARWAVFFDAAGINWQYEPEGYEIKGTRYLPDFLIFTERGPLFVEVKPVLDERSREKITAMKGTGAPIYVVGNMPVCLQHVFLEHSLNRLYYSNPWNDPGASSNPYFFDFQDRTSLAMKKAANAGFEFGNTPQAVCQFYGPAYFGEVISDKNGYKSATIRSEKLNQETLWHIATELEEMAQMPNKVKRLERCEKLLAYILGEQQAANAMKDTRESPWMKVAGPKVGTHWGNPGQWFEMFDKACVVLPRQMIAAFHETGIDLPYSLKMEDGYHFAAAVEKG